MMKRNKFSKQKNTIWKGPKFNVGKHLAEVQDSLGIVNEKETVQRYGWRDTVF